MLDWALASLAAQTAPRGEFEVLVVDNGPHASTRRVVESYAGKLPVRYAAEPRRGRAYARNTSYELARTEYVAYMDDDALARRDWIERMLDVIRADAPAIFGGPYCAYYLTEKPRWYRDEYGSNDLGPAPRRLDGPPWLTSANLVLRRDLLERIAGFSLAYGMPDALPLGQDTEVQLRARRQIPGLEIRYYPQIVVDHLTPGSKMNLRAFLRRRWQRGRIGAHMARDEGVRYSRREVIRHVIANALAVLWRSVVGLRRDVREYRYYQNWFIAEVLPAVSGLSAAVERLRWALGRRSAPEPAPGLAQGWVGAEREMAAECEPGLVSVIVPSYNRADLIAETLQSVREQSHRPIELIVVDDGSTDNTAEVVRNFARQDGPGFATKYICQENQGAPAARNRGLVESHGEFIQFLDSDDLLKPDKLREQVRAMRQGPDVQLVFSRWQWLEQGDTPRTQSWRAGFRADLGRLLDFMLGADPRQTLPVSTGNTLYRRDLCVRAGPWETALVRMQDRLYNLRVLLLGAPCRYLPVVHDLVRRHGGDQISDHFGNARNVENMRAAWLKIRAMCEQAGALDRRRRRLLGRMYYSLARPAYVAGADELGKTLLRDGLAVAPLSATRARLWLTRALYGALGTSGANRLFAAKMRVTTVLQKLRPGNGT